MDLFLHLLSLCEEKARSFHSLAIVKSRSCATCATNALRHLAHVAGSLT
ncbi:hypothetical protein CCACVL1_00423, partial [Corchorus capsularis]